jgi:hypothetical protein
MPYAFRFNRRPKPTTVAPILLFEHDLFGKPLHTFPDHAPLIEDFVNARASGLFDSPFSGPARRLA